MRNYTVLAPPLSEGSGAPEALRLVFVKDGFCWPALLLTLPWMLYRRLFLEAAVLIAVVVALAALGRLLDVSTALPMAALSLALGVIGNDLRCLSLQRRGYRLSGSATGRSIDEAEIRYFFDQPAEELAATVPPRVLPATLGPVIGLFPTAEGAR